MKCTQFNFCHYAAISNNFHTQLTLFVTFIVYPKDMLVGHGDLKSQDGVRTGFGSREVGLKREPTDKTYN